MLAVRIAGRVLSRTASFGFKGALAMAVAGVFEGFILGAPLDLMPHPQEQGANGSQSGALVMMLFGLLFELLVFAFVGAWTSRRDDARVVFAKSYRSAITGSFVGAIIGAVCFASLFAMLTWLTNGNFLPVPARSLWLALGSIKASAAIGYFMGIIVGFFAGTALGAWRGATTAIKRESSTRTETN